MFDRESEAGREPMREFVKFKCHTEWYKELLRLVDWVRKNEDPEISFGRWARQALTAEAKRVEERMRAGRRR